MGTSSGSETVLTNPSPRVIFGHVGKVKSFVRIKTNSLPKRKPCMPASLRHMGTMIGLVRSRGDAKWRRNPAAGSAPTCAGGAKRGPFCSASCTLRRGPCSHVLALWSLKRGAKGSQGAPGLRTCGKTPAARDCPRPWLGPECHSAVAPSCFARLRRCCANVLRCRTRTVAASRCCVHAVALPTVARCLHVALFRRAGARSFGPVALSTVECAPRLEGRGTNRKRFAGEECEPTISCKLRRGILGHSGRRRPLAGQDERPLQVGRQSKKEPPKMVKT